MVNKVILVGNLGKDPEVRQTQNSMVANFSLATSETFMKDGEKKTVTEWHNIVIWGKQAEIADKYLKKGSKVYIEGKLQTRSWDDKDGNKRYTTEVNVQRFQMLDAKAKPNEAAPVAEVVGKSSGDDDLPF